MTLRALGQETGYLDSRPPSSLRARRGLTCQWMKAQTSSLVEFLAGVLGVVKQQLARRELAPVDSLIFPHAVHQPLGPIVVCEPEGACHNTCRIGGWGEKRKE